jgi:hypothetical protein
MRDESQQLLPESQPENPPNTPIIISSPPRKSRRKIWLIGGIVCGTLCLFSIICFAIFALIKGNVNDEKAPVESVIDSYMKFMSARDFENAYALFSPRAHRTVPISKIQELVEGNNYLIFEGYQSLSIRNLGISTVAITNPDLPQGTVANVTGTITYEDGIQGSFNCILEKVDEKWQIDGVYVTVPPSKIK